MTGERGQLSCSVQRLHGGVSVVRAVGHLDGEARTHMHRLVVDEVRRTPSQLLLEVSGVTSIGDAAVTVLIGASALAGESDVALCLIASSHSPVVKALTAADVIERFEISPTIDQALDQRASIEWRSVCDGDSPNS